MTAAERVRERLDHARRAVNTERRSALLNSLYEDLVALLEDYESMSDCCGQLAELLAQTKPTGSGK